jgi:hypothetical protein
MPKRTGNSSVNSSIRQNTAAAGEGFSQLLNLQQLSNEKLESMNTALSVSLLDAMKDIAKNLKQSSPSISSSSIVNNSNSSTAAVVKSKEDRNEGDAIQNKKIALLEKIEANTRGNIVSVDSSKTKSGGIGSLGGFATALAVALGAIVGAFKAQLKAIKYFAEIFTPEKMIMSIRKTIAAISVGITMQFDLIKAAISEKLSGVGKVFDTVIESIKSVFTISEESKIGKFIKSVSSGLSTLFAPFIEAFTLVKDFMAGTASKAFTVIKDIFSTIGSKFGSFVEVFKKVVGIFEKLFLPLTIVMTIWDTVKGTIEGFEKEGIVGGIKGAITGFFNSLIFGPADMIKDAIAWVAGIFGFENAKKELESFSFEKMFSNLVNTLFEMPKAIGNWVVDMYNKLKSLEIPKVGLKIPGTSLEFSVGPFKPFAGLPGGGATQSNDTTGGSTIQGSAAPNIAPSPAQSSVAPSQSVAQSSNQVSAMKENQSSNITSNVVSPTVNNNVKQTQVAKIDAPIRTEDSSVDRYFSSRARFI